MIVYTFEICFHDPWSGARMKGKRQFGDDTIEEMRRTIARYDAYYKDQYNDKYAYCRLLKWRDTSIRKKFNHED